MRVPGRCIIGCGRGFATRVAGRDNPRQMPGTSPRFDSVDCLRGVVMFAMLFVNDVAGVPSIPWWLKHYEPSTASGMTFVDWVFGGFLFIVGVSIPLAFDARKRKGDSTATLLAHVMTRTLGLLLLGVMMVNGDASPKTTFYPPHLWATLLYTFAILAFISPRNRKIGLALRVIGFLGLAFLAFTFRNASGQILQTKWWGILGLIGWAYLVASLVFLLVRGRTLPLAIAAAMLLGLWVIDRRGMFEGALLRKYIDIGAGLGSQSAIAVMGAMLGGVILDLRPIGRKILWAVVIGAILLFAALLVFKVHGVNKNNATPAWCLICAGATAWLWAILCLLIDFAGIKRPLHLFTRGGQNVLLAYLLAPLWIHFILLVGLTFYSRWASASPVAGAARSLVLATVILYLAGVLKDRGVRMRL